MRDRNLPAVGETRFQTNGSLSINDGDPMPGLGEIPRTADADHTGAEDQYVHAGSCSRTMRTASGIRFKLRIKAARCLRPVTRT